MNNATLTVAYWTETDIVKAPNRRDEATKQSPARAIRAQIYRDGMPIFPSAAIQTAGNDQPTRRELDAEGYGLAWAVSLGQTLLEDGSTGSLGRVVLLFCSVTVSVTDRVCGIRKYNRTNPWRVLSMDSDDT